jgi:cyclopropane fatty-acyl-phospholipid synthase-like methyltransferase
MSILYDFINPIKWVKAFRYAKKNSKFSKSDYDLELFLYSRILTNDMLHYGHFDDTNVACETISIKQFEDAQIKYAENILEQITDSENPVLDVGCGMGGLSNLILQKGIPVECLTPNKNQIDYINKKYTKLKTYSCKYQNFETGNKYGTIINSESLQYIPLEDAFRKTDELLLQNGRWIIVDYFRLNDNGINKSSHLLSDFRNKINQMNWKIAYEKDITLNILPTVSFANMYLTRFLIPLKHFVLEKFRFKKPKLYYMTDKIRTKIDKKIEKERAAIDPEMFLREKKYMFFVLEKKG